MYKYLFGPIPSRRLGMSLGIDLVPKKICSLNCVYCEVGKTTKLTTEVKEYVLEKNIKKEIEDYLKNNQDPDTFTLTGSGEPTLNSKIGSIINFLRNKRPNANIAVLTNGTLMNIPEIREKLLNANIILPSLDAVLEKSFNKINRPDSSINIKEYIDGLVEFRKMQLNKQDSINRVMWLEILILPSYNDSKEDLIALKKAIVKINPTSVQLNTLDRPGTIKNLRGCTRSELEKIKDFLNLDIVEIISPIATRKNIKEYKGDIESSILETLERRPCTIDDFVRILGPQVNQINKYLDILVSEDKIYTEEEERGIFYQLKNKIQE